MKEFTPKTVITDLLEEAGLREHLSTDHTRTTFYRKDGRGRKHFVCSIVGSGLVIFDSERRVEGLDVHVRFLDLADPDFFSKFNIFCTKIWAEF